MKEYEKLSEEFVESKTHPDPAIVSMLRLAYEIGFLKAREMATELTKKPAWITIRDMPKLGEKEI